MMFEKAASGINEIKNLADDIKLIYLYRYFSLILTSLFYLLGGLRSPLTNKLIVIGCLSIASVLLNNLYVKNQDNKNIIRVLVCIEIIGNMLILIPTGGLNSPYIWYSLNTILVTVSFLNVYYCWFNLFVYLFFSTLISSLLLNKDNERFVQILFDNSNLILSFILVTMAAQLLLTLMKKLKKESKNLTATNTQLTVSNERLKESIDSIMSLYQAVHSFVNQNQKSELFDIIVEYTEKITKSDMAFFSLNVNQEEWILNTSKKIDKNYNFILSEKIKSQWNVLKQSNSPMKLCINDAKYMVISIKSSYIQHGVLGIEIKSDQSEIFYKDNLDQMKFLSELSSIALEKFRLEEVNAHLLVSGEQNRIANEIHDSVSQRLFSISCGIYGLIQKAGKITEEELKNELSVIKDSLNKTMKDLRETIYGLSWEKGGKDMFKFDIMNYIKEVSRLNGIDISFNVEGNEELLDYDLKKAIYRIICEGTGNAVRHGNCSRIEIILDIKEGDIKLTIVDNGRGFCLNNMDKSSRGLGIKNMVNLVKSFNGKINIDSQIGKGTVINVLFNKYIYREQGDVL